MPTGQWNEPLHLLHLPHLPHLLLCCVRLYVWLDLHQTIGVQPLDADKVGTVSTKLSLATGTGVFCIYYHMKGMKVSTKLAHFKQAGLGYACSNIKYMVLPPIFEVL